MAQTIETIAPADVYQAARRRLGTPWRHQGRNDRGLDCLGLLVVVASELEIPHQDYRNYRTSPDGKSLIAALDKQLIRKDIPRPDPGEIMVFKIDLYPVHVAFAGWRDNRLTMIHSRRVTDEATDCGSVIEHPIDPKWLRRLTHVYKLPGVSPWRP